MKKALVVATTLAFAAGLAVSSLAADMHPEMHSAAKRLEKAKADLQHAAHDYDGHRTAAIRAIDNALAEIRTGIDWQDHHH